MPHIHRQPAASDPTHVISTNYKQINSALDVIQRATRILTKKMSNKRSPLETRSFKNKETPTSRELPSNIEVSFSEPSEGKPGCVYFCHVLL